MTTSSEPHLSQPGGDDERDRLVAELRAARADATRRADEARTLREIAGRIAAIRDPVETLETIVRETRRLLASDVAGISLVRPLAGRSVFSMPEIEPDPADVVVPEDGHFEDLPGVWGRALALGRPVATGDYLADDSFIHHPLTDARAAAAGLRSVAATTIPGDPRPLGSLQVASLRPDAYGPRELDLLEALASQAASAIASAVRLADLAASRAELAHRADVERALREIAARVSASRDVDEVVGMAIVEATRLLDGDSARVDVYEPAVGLLRGIYTSEGAAPTADEWPDTPEERVDQGLSGQAYTRGRTAWTGDYLADDSFPHGSGADTYVRNLGLRSIIAAPLIGEVGPFGALTVMSRRPQAFGPDHRDLLEGIAAQVATSLATARLIDDLDRSRAELSRRVERERTLREIGARLTEVASPEDLLRRIVAEASRLVEADGSRIDLLDESTMRLRWAYADGETASADARLLREVGLGMGEGVAGRAAAEGHAVRTGDYLVDPLVRPSEAAIRFVEETGVRSVVSTPLPGLGRPLGTLSVLARRQNAFSDADVELLATFALQASIAIMNSRRLQALARATEENARRAATERALREIAARIGELRDPVEIVQLTVDEAARLLGADAARVDVIGSGGAVAALPRALGEIVSSGAVGSGVHESGVGDAGLEGAPGVAAAAAHLGRAFGTGDYLADPSFERRPEEAAAIRRLGIRSALAAPIAGGEGPIGALTVLSRAKDAFDLDAGATLEALASLAAVALRNASLLELVTASEARLRDLVATSPDLVWEADAEGRLLFVSGLAEEVLGRPASELTGSHFAEVVHPATLHAALAAWEALRTDPHGIHTARFALVGADGAEVPVENVAVPLLEDGRFVGARGAARDVRERERLERELRAHAGALAASAERAHLARELHDSITQALFSIGLTASSIEVLLDRDLAAARRKLGDLRELQRDALAEMRSLIFELRPGSLEREGLASALRTHAAGVEGRLGLPIVLDVADVGRLPLAVEDALYRIAQEGLHNIVKHARAEAVRIELTRDGSVVELRVVDDGVGFDPAIVAEGSLGLASMRARAERVGGHLEVRSGPGRGTTIEVVVPLERDGAGP